MDWIENQMLPIRMDVGLGSLNPVSTIVRSPWWTRDSEIGDTASARD